jgi:hypothetical protein
MISLITFPGVHDLRDYDDIPHSFSNYPAPVFELDTDLAQAAAGYHLLSALYDCDFGRIRMERREHV